MNAASMLLGAALVVLGVLSGALADRIRHSPLRSARNRPPRDPLRLDQGQPALTTPAHDRMRCDVIAALVQSGFRKAEAAEAARACKGSEQASLESWIRAALKLANQGVAS